MATLLGAETGCEPIGLVRLQLTGAFPNVLLATCRVGYRMHRMAQFVPLQAVQGRNSPNCDTARTDCATVNTHAFARISDDSF